jgi:hypothetical protein
MGIVNTPDMAGDPQAETFCALLRAGVPFDEAAARSTELADGQMQVTVSGNTQHIVLNNDGAIWRCCVTGVDTPAGADKAADAASDARRFLESATVLCAADDAAELMERARAAANRARLHVATSLVCLAHVMPGDDLRAMRLTLEDLDVCLAEIRAAYSNLIDVGARQLVDVQLAPADIPVFGVDVSAAVSPPAAGTKRTGEAVHAASPVIDDDAFWTAAAQSLTEGDDAQ